MHYELINQAVDQTLHPVDGRIKVLQVPETVSVSYIHTYILYLLFYYSSNACSITISWPSSLGVFLITTQNN